MIIVFYNLNHIGDCYISSFFINILVEQNKNIDFNYFFIQGDSFLKKTHNLKRINNIECQYYRPLQSGEPPENLLNNNFLNFLLKEKFQKSQMRREILNNKEYLFLNTWCAAPTIKHSDFDLKECVEGWKRLIEQTSNIMQLSLNFDLHCYKYVVDIFQDYPEYALDKEERKKNE